jgi:GT2 family glycosyltransferase
VEGPLAGKIGKMSQTKLVSVVIPNWNGKKFLAGCLGSLKTQTYENHEIIVVDNGSIDGSCEYIEENYPETTLVRFSKNTGFSVAVNSGIKKAKGTYIALLNNDTVVAPDWLAFMVEALERTPEAGSVACKMLSYEDHTLLDGAGDGYRRGGLPGRIGHRERDFGQFETERFVLGPCGGACLYRRQVFDTIGFLDEDYFAYLEDVDLGLRAQSAGFKCLYVPQAVVYHLGCGTTGSGYSPMVVRLSAQNNINTMVKNLPAPLLIKFLPQIVYWQSFYLAVVVLRGGQFFPWLHGIFSAMLLFPNMLGKRAVIEKSRVASTAYLESIIVQSEIELKASKERLYQQVREGKAMVESESKSGVVNSRLTR